MRAFAKQIGLGQSAVSQVLAGRKNFSLETAAKIAKKLKLSDSEAEYFRLLVQIEATKNQDLKSAFIERAQSLNSRAVVRDVSVDLFASIADWYHVAIESLAEIKDFSMAPSSIAKQLGISELEAEVALKRLLRLGMLEQDPQQEGKLRKAKGYSATTSNIPNEALRRFHRQMLEKAIDSLEVQSPQEKFIGTETFAIAKENLPQAFNLADEFLQKLFQLAETSEPKTDVYHVGLQIFNLSKNKEKK